MILQIKTFENNMDANVYIEIMGEYILPNIRSMYGNNWYLQQDNDPKHSSYLSRTFLAYNIVICVGFKIIINCIIRYLIAIFQKSARPLQILLI